MTTGKTIALTIGAFVGKVMSQLFNMLPMSVITFILRSKHLLISWLQSASVGISEPPKIKSVTVYIVSRSISHEEMGIPNSWLLRNLCAGQEATVKHGTIDWFQIGKGVHQGCILSPCLFNLYAEYIMWNSGLDEAQAGIKIAGRNMNNLRYAENTTLMAESEE